MFRLIVNKSGYIFRGTLGMLAVIAVIYFVASATGLREDIVASATAAEISPENITFRPYEMIQPEITGHSEITTIKTCNRAGSNIIITCDVAGVPVPARIDTGLGFADICVSTNLMTRLGLKFYPLNEIWTGITGGICYLENIKIEGLQIDTPRTAYIDQHRETQIWGMTIEQDYQLSIGLGILEKFSYVKFDNSVGQIEFGLKDQFEPSDGMWQKFPLRIGNDRYLQRRIFVDVPVDGVDCEMVFDTCGGDGLKVSKGLWESIGLEGSNYSKNAGYVNSTQFGTIGCDEITVPIISIAGRDVKDAKVFVMPDDVRYFDNILPMSVFSDTAVVIDFQSRLLWVDISN